ncbi:hypothetical protein HDZ31DRAFT_33216, partial [Schizophyllum fasciatum]
IYEHREDGSKPDPAFRFPVEFAGDDSESDVGPEDTDITYIKPEMQGEDDEDAEPVQCSQRSWARRGCTSPPPFHEEAADYAQIVRPAYYEPGPIREAAKFPRPEGAVITRFLRVPSDLRHENMNAVIRYPELVKRVGHEAVIPVKRIADRLCRIVVQTEHGGLVIKNVNGKKIPCLVPMDRNDLWTRYKVSDAHTDIIPDLICLEGKGRKGCRMNPPRRWNPSTWNQVRWCRRCETFLHVVCIRHFEVDLCMQAHRLDAYGQPYLRYHLEEHNFALDDPPRMPFADSADAELQDDVHDEMELFPMPRTTWHEVAALPIRRRTFPMEAPETNEIVIQHAIQQVAEGNGAAVVPDVDEWLHEIAPLAGLRGAKVILNKNLRQLRSVGKGSGPRWYLCPGCEAQIV